jgi:hypothetical protein
MPQGSHQPDMPNSTILAGMRVWLFLPTKKEYQPVLSIREQRLTWLIHRLVLIDGAKFSEAAIAMLLLEIPVPTKRQPKGLALGKRA